MPTRVCSGAPDFNPPTASINSKPRPHRPLGVILVGLRIAEVDEHAVAHVLRYKPAEALHSLGDALLIGRNDLAQVLRVHTRRERCRTDEVREHHGNLAALGGVLRGEGRCSAASAFGAFAAAFGEFGYRPQQLETMTERHPDLFKVLIREIGQD